MLQNIGNFFTKRKNKSRKSDSENTKSSKSDSLNLRISVESTVSSKIISLKNNQLNNTFADAESLKSIFITNEDPALDSNPVYSRQQP